MEKGVQGRDPREVDILLNSFNESPPSNLDGGDSKVLLTKEL